MYFYIGFAIKKIGEIYVFFREMEVEIIFGTSFKRHKF